MLSPVVASEHIFYVFIWELSKIVVALEKEKQNYNFIQSQLDKYLAHSNKWDIKLIKKLHFCYGFYYRFMLEIRLEIQKSVIQCISMFEESTKVNSLKFF